MRFYNGQIRLSASDLTKFAACSHATRLDFDYLHGRGPDRAEDSEEAIILSEFGTKHEKAYLEELEASSKQCINIQAQIGHNAPFDDSLRATRAALQSGVDVIFQGALANNLWGGYVDFLERTNKSSQLGSFSYEVVDTKLKRKPDPSHILQLVVYSDLLTEIQGVIPEFMHIELGTGERSTHRIVEFAHYVRAMQKRLEAFVQKPSSTRPIPCTMCDLCHWRKHCTNQWEQGDSLFLVAGIRKTQVSKLENAGIETMGQLAQYPKPIRKMAPQTFNTLKVQAKMQSKRKDGKPSVDVRPRIPGKGFDLLPRPNKGDLFYDIEGYPHYSENGDPGLEYLHGIWDGREFTAFWAHNHTEEKQALKDLFAFFKARLADFPEAHIYHYAPYEMTALRRITARYGVEEALLDQWQRDKRFVDLYAVVRGGIIASEKGYSLKDLEVFYEMPREGEVTTSGGSVVAYHKWLQLDKEDPKAKIILQELYDYNEIDCISTERLRDWLLSLRPEDSVWHELGESTSELMLKQQAEYEELQRALDRAAHVDESLGYLLYNLTLFHKREAKPAAWAVFDSLKKERIELIEDPNCLAGLKRKGRPNYIKSSIEYKYRFPPQETKLAKNKRANIADKNGRFYQPTITELNRYKREVTLKIGQKSAHVLEQNLLDLLPSFALQTGVIQRAIQDVLEDQLRSSTNQVADDLLERAAPRFRGPSPLTQEYENVLEQMIAATKAMDHTILSVQGPPGTGKTYVTARTILALVKDGHRVAISSNSHEAILNVLIECADALLWRRGRLSGGVTLVHKGGLTETRKDPRIVRVTKNNAPQITNGDVVGGTAWLFCRPEMADAPFDYLFVDEAGQVSLANLLGMTRCADNVVLVGDPCQLPQVIQGSHPNPANLSCLDWMLGDDRLIKKGRGIFLNETWRMHPELCKYISTQFYEDQLQSHSSTALQAVYAEGLPKYGAFRVEVSHRNCSQVSDEEISAIKLVVERLLKGRWTDRYGRNCPIERGGYHYCCSFQCTSECTFSSVTRNSCRHGGQVSGTRGSNCNSIYDIEFRGRCTARV